MPKALQKTKKGGKRLAANMAYLEAVDSCLETTLTGAIADRAFAHKSKAHSKFPSHIQTSIASQKDERHRDQALQKICAGANKEKISASDRHSEPCDSRRQQFQELSPELQTKSLIEASLYLFPMQSYGALHQMGIT